tara:strand:+ start:483 stop:2069 length:1587 start_codon:yes stop_codon:yes gene_type:complete
MKLAQEKMLDEIELDSKEPRTNSAIPDHEIVVVGSGISGLGVAIELKRRGIESFIILERAQDVGGTWRDNRYPGVAVDIPSLVYSFSFEQNPNWSRVYAPGDELQNYSRRLASKYGIYPKIRFGVSVEDAEFDEVRNLWKLRTDSGLITARHLVAASGGLVTPKLPEINGLEGFKGKVMHSAQWDESYDLAGKRVAVIGTGASAVQLIPKIAPDVEHLDVYQRTPIWVLKKPDGKIPAVVRTAFRWFGGLQNTARVTGNAMMEAALIISTVYYKRAPWLVRFFEGVGRKNLEEQLPDHPELREKLMPKYGFGCKRPTFSNDYFSTFTRDNVELVTTSIESVSPTGIRTADGEERDIDVLILATGFKLFDKDNLPTFKVRGREGEVLGEFWDENRYQAYEGMTIPGYPNFYIMLGPYALVGSSYFVMVEGNATHLARLVQTARERDATCVEVRQDAHDRYFENVQQRQKNTVFFNNNCSAASSYYFDKHGDAPLVRPSTSVEMLLRANFLPMKHYRFKRTPAAALAKQV